MVSLPTAAMHLKNLGFTMATSHTTPTHDEENVISSEKDSLVLGQPLVKGGATRNTNNQHVTPVKS